MTENRTSALVFCLYLFLAVTVGLGLTASLSSYFSLGSPGTTDYVQYWSAFRALQRGLNPYDGVMLHEIQSTVGQRPDATILMWNPPWTCLFLAPFLTLPFSYSAALWFLFSVGLLLVIARVAVHNNKQLPFRYATLASLLFYPIIESLSLGQVGVFMAAALALSLFCLERREPIGAGLSVLPLSIKPHLFFLLVPISIVWITRMPREERRLLIGTTVGGMLFLLALTECIWPGATAAWIHAFGGNPDGPGTVPTAMWKTATAATVIRTLLSQSTGYPPSWPLIATPLIAFTTVGVWILIKHRKIVSLPYTTLCMLCLSLLFGSYGWLFDQSLLVLCQLSILCDACSSERATVRYSLVGGLVAIFLTAVLCKYAVQDAAQHHYTWIPAAMLLLMLLAHRSTRDRSMTPGRSSHPLYESPAPSL